MHSTLQQVQARVAKLVERGVPLERIESELIDAVDLEEEERAAAWLYAWTLAGRSDAPSPHARAAPGTFDSRDRPRVPASRVFSRVASLAAAVVPLPGL